MPADPSASEIRAALWCGRSGCECRTGPNVHCPGPSHANGDRHPSLTVHESGGKVLVNCKGTCDQDAVIAALQDRDLWPRREIRSWGSGRIVATYDYRDADGTLAFQVVRISPKAFRQRRPDGNGGWIWKKGDTRILYRLPELLAADPAEIVWNAEGEKDCDRLASLGLIATTRAEGAGKWQDANSTWLRGRRVVILADNDEAGRSDAERRLASIRKVARVAAILALDALPEHGDVSDWLDLGGTLEHLIALGEAVLGEAEADQRGAAANVVTLEMVAFPTEILPPSMVRLVQAGSVALNVPPEFIAVPLLVLSGTAIGNAWALEVKKGWRESPSLYAAVVGDPGSGKTPALKIAQKPLIAIQDLLAEEYADEKRAYDVELAAWEAASKKERGAKPEPPRFYHVWTSDPTTEVLAAMLPDTKGLAYIRDELAGWVAAMDAYRNGKGADRQHFLSMWGGAAIKIDRKSRPDPIRANNPCLSIVGGIQPDKLPSLVDRGDTEDGFLDRMLWSYPDLGRSRWTPNGVEEAVEEAVAELFLKLHRLEACCLPSGKLAPNLARLDPQARSAWEIWFNERAAEAEEDGFPSSLKGAWSKLPAQLARVTLILHVTAAVDAGLPVSHTVPIETVAAAMDLLEYFKEHARYSLASVRTSRATLKERLIRILAERGPQSTTELFAALGGKIKRDRLHSALERLVEDGRVECRPGETTERGGRPPKLWAIPETSEPVSFVRRSEGRAWKS